MTAKKKTATKAAKATTATTATTDALDAGAEREEQAIQAEERKVTEAVAPIAEMGSAPWEEPQPAEEYSADEPEAAVVGSIAPSTEPDIAAVLPTFPHDLDGSHALDSISVGDIVRKTTETGYSRQTNAHFSDGNLIATGDALAHLPVGSTIEKNDGGQIVMTMPETETRGPFLTFGKNVHRCVAQAWPWLVGEGHAKVS